MAGSVVACEFVEQLLLLVFLHFLDRLLGLRSDVFGGQGVVCGRAELCDRLEVRSLTDSYALPK